MEKEAYPISGEEEQNLSPEIKQLAEEYFKNIRLSLEEVKEAFSEENLNEIIIQASDFKEKIEDLEEKWRDGGSNRMDEDINNELSPICSDISNFTNSIKAISGHRLMGKILETKSKSEKLTQSSTFPGEDASTLNILGAQMQHHVGNSTGNFHLDMIEADLVDLNRYNTVGRFEKLKEIVSEHLISAFQNGFNCYLMMRNIVDHQDDIINNKGKIEYSYYKEYSPFQASLRDLKEGEMYDPKRLISYLSSGKLPTIKGVFVDYNEKFQETFGTSFSDLISKVEAGEQPEEVIRNLISNQLTRLKEHQSSTERVFNKAEGLGLFSWI